jgi:hypothetical protein
MLSENVYQDLFLRAGEYLLDEQLISGQKMSKFAFFNSLEQHFAPYSGYWSQKKKKKKLSRTNYIVKSGFPIYVVRNQIYINLDF